MITLYKVFRLWLLAAAYLALVPPPQSIAMAASCSFSVKVPCTFQTNIELSWEGTYLKLIVTPIAGNCFISIVAAVAR